VIQKRPATGLLANLYEPINVYGHLGYDAVLDYLGLSKYSIESIEYLDPKKHVFSHIDWEMIGYHITLKKCLAGYNFVTKQDLQSNYSIPTAFQYYIQWVVADHPLHH
jgi:A/G-specific adenine glycosylase